MGISARLTIHAWSVWRGEGRKGGGTGRARCVVAGVGGASTGCGGVAGAVLSAKSWPDALLPPSESTALHADKATMRFVSRPARFGNGVPGTLATAVAPRLRWRQLNGTCVWLAHSGYPHEPWPVRSRETRWSITTKGRCFVREFRESRE